MALTARQQTILNFVQEFIEKYRYAPTVNEIRIGCRMTTTSLVAYHLKQMEQAGAIGRKKKVARGLWLIVGH